MRHGATGQKSSSLLLYREDDAGEGRIPRCAGTIAQRMTNRNMRGCTKLSLRTSPH